MTIQRSYMETEFVTLMLYGAYISPYKGLYSLEIPYLYPKCTTKEKLKEDAKRFKNVSPSFDLQQYNNNVDECSLVNIKIVLKENFEKILQLAHEAMPPSCKEGWREVKFCPIRNGDGNECKLCSEYRNESRFISECK